MSGSSAVINHANNNNKNIINGKTDGKQLVTSKYDSSSGYQVTVTHRNQATILQTSPAASFPDSNLVVTSSPNGNQFDDDILNDLQGGKQLLLWLNIRHRNILLCTSTC